MGRSNLFLLFLLIISSILILTGCLPSQSADAADVPMQFVPQSSIAQTGTIIRIEPTNQQLKLGDVATVEIQIDNATNLTAAEIKLQFNPAIFQVQDMEPDKDGVQLLPGSFPAPDFVALNVITNTTGIIQYALAQLPPSEPVNGGGLLAGFTIQAIAPGSSDLTFLTTNLVVSEGQLIPVTAQSGQVTVGQIPGSPTVTSLPAITTTTTPPILSTATNQPTTLTPSPLTPTTTPTSSPTPMPTITPIPTVTPSPVPPPSPTPTAIPPITQIPEGATLGFCYHVQEGDTLYSLGQQYGVSADFISLANDLYPPDYVYIHQVLFMPTQQGYGPNVYKKRAGDTLTSIANECRLSVSMLASVNQLDETAVLQDRHVLIIPIPPFPPPSRFKYPLPVFPYPNN